MKEMQIQFHLAGHTNEIAIGSIFLNKFRWCYVRLNTSLNGDFWGIFHKRTLVRMPVLVDTILAPRKVCFGHVGVGQGVEDDWDSDLGVRLPIVRIA